MTESPTKAPSKMFDFLIDYLREDFPDKEINQLCNLAWRLIGNGKVIVALAPGDAIPTNIGFAVIGNEFSRTPAVLLREDWLEFVKTDRIMGLGSIVFVASQIRDQYNSRLSLPESSNRARMYEAQMLLALQQQEQFEPNDWQRAELEEFPNGINHKLLYTRKSFMGAS